MSAQTTVPTLHSVNPATGELIGSLPISTAADVDLAVSQAKAATPAWSALSINERLAFVDEFHRQVFERRLQIGQVVTRETGKPLIESWGSELFGVLETARWLQKNAAEILAPHTVSINPLFFPFHKAYNLNEPVGTVAVISPWNYPFAIPVSTMLAALVAGNSVILKPSPKTPLVGQMIKGLFDGAGFGDLVQVVHGDREPAAHLVGSAVDRVVFTGSVAGGKAIMGMCAQPLHPVTLELGGKHPAIVLDDVDLDKAARGLVWSAFTNAGQACASVERLYVPRSIAPQLVALICKYTAQLRLGNGLDPDIDVGPMIDAGQLERVKQLVDSSIAAGARLVCGGKLRPDLGENFMEPTVLTDVRHDMPVIKNEIFGPVLPVVVVDSIEEAVRLANDCELALGASVWTRDGRRGTEVARQIRAGMVWVNDALFTHSCPATPWGGMKASGFGSTHGAKALHDFVNAKCITVAGEGNRDWYFPYSREQLDYVRDGVELCHARGFKQRIVSLWRLAMAKLGWR